MNVSPEVVCEQLGDEFVVVSTSSSSAMSVTGESATALRRVLDGDTPAGDDPGVQQLVDQGIILVSPSGLSRRSLVLGVTAAAAGGVVALSLPPAAYASSSFALATPVFTNEPGETYISNSVSGESVGNEIASFDRLRFDFARFSNRGDYPAGSGIEWSFTENGNDFQAFPEDADPDRERYEWNGLGVIVPSANRVPGTTRFTVWLRVASGSDLSAAVEVQFFWNDG